jgi:hypothetical protein
MSDDLPTRLRRLLDRRPRTDEETELVVDEIEKVIRALEQVQMDLTRARLRKRE